MNIKMKINSMWPQRLLIAVACALFTVSGVASLQVSAEENGLFVVISVENPKCCGNELFRAFENYYSPRIGELRTRYGLDAVVGGETDEWTPNVITSKVTILDGKAHVFLSSCTPNFQTFQTRGDNGIWRDCGEEMDIPLDSRANKHFVFRTINLFAVVGPEHHVEIAWRQES